MSFAQYLRFIFVGAFVGVVTIGCRELIGLILHGDTRQNFTISVLLAYAVGIALSYFLNQRFTFDRGDSAGLKAFLRFVAVALLGLVSTAVLAVTLRYGANLDLLIGPLARPVAFATATVLSTLITYPLNARFVFGSRPSGAGAGCVT
jgi:putative flippase GtrA